MYDIMVVGGGPAGLTAAVYSARAGYKTAIVESLSMCGGQMAMTDVVENYPGIICSDGFDIAEKMQKQAENIGVEIITSRVVGLSQGECKTVITENSEYESRAVIIATGTRHKKLGVCGEKEHEGKGVSYCAVCDGNFYRGKTAAVIGGGNSALKSALYLSRICSKVYLIHRRDAFRGDREKLDGCIAAENITILRNTHLREISGDDMVSSITVENENGKYTIETDAVFVNIGMEPVSGIVSGICDTDDAGYIIAGEDCGTSASGIFAVGDVRTKKQRQIVTACADGANAADSAGEYLS